MGWFEDAVAWVEDAVEDVGEAVSDAVDWVGDAVEDAAEWVGDAVENVGEAVVQSVVGVGETLVDFGEAVGAVAGGANWDETWADFGMNAADNLIFDPVDYLTGGDVNLDYDDGAFTADVGIDFGIGSVGLQVGAAGFSASSSFDIGIASGSISLDSSAGFAASGSLGIAGGPLPYMEGHLSIDADGGVLIGGELQGSLPIPGGYIGASMGGELELNPDGSWGAAGSFDGEFDGPMGIGADLDVDGSVAMDPLDGDADFDLSVDAGASGPGGMHADVDTDFDLSLDAGVLTQTTGVDVDASLGGQDFDGGAAITTSVGGGDVSVTGDTWGDLDDPFVQADDGAAQFEAPPAAVAPPEPAPIDDPEPAPLDDFSQDIQATEQLAEAADDMWDGLGQ